MCWPGHNTHRDTLHINLRGTPTKNGKTRRKKKVEYCVMQSARKEKQSSPQILHSPGHSIFVQLRACHLPRCPMWSWTQNWTHQFNQYALGVQLIGHVYGCGRLIRRVFPGLESRAHSTAGQYWTPVLRSILWPPGQLQVHRGQLG